MSNILGQIFSGVRADFLVRPSGRGERAISGGTGRRSADSGRCRCGPQAQTLGSSRKQPLVDTVARLKELGIEYQLQLAQLVFLALSPPKFQELFIRDEFQLARF